MIEIGPPPQLWMPPRPAIIRSAADIADRATFPFPTFAPRVKRFPVVQGVSGSTGSGSSICVALPSGVAAKDLLVIFLISSSGDLISTPTGWTGLKENASLQDISVAIFSKVAAGGETSVNVGHSGSSTDMASLSYRISGAALPVQIAYAGPSGSNPNPPSLTVPWGVDKTLWLAASLARGFSGSYPPNAPPSGFSGLQSREFNNALVAVAQSSQEVATLNPDSFSQVIDGYAFAATVAVRGA
jgi:hypothetical protein